MDQREQVAHHEAAHVVVSALFGGGPTLHGIDIDAGTSVTGAFGNAGVGLLVIDDTQPEEEQRHLLVQNIAIICAGAAADAKITARKLNDALQRQPGDLSVAKAAIERSRLVTGNEEGDHVLQVGLEYAETLLDKSDIWDAVVRIAKACLANRGKLSKDEIEALLFHSVAKTRTLAVASLSLQIG